MSEQIQVTPSRIDTLLACIPDSPIRQKLVAEIVMLEDLLSASKARETELREKLEAAIRAQNELHEQIYQYQQRVKVLTDAMLKLSEMQIVEQFEIIETALNATPQQTAAQIERWHIEWMMKLPVVAYSYKSSKGHDIVNHEFCRGLIAICPSDMVVTKLVAIPPLPKESNSPETDLDEALRRQ